MLRRATSLIPLFKNRSTLYFFSEQQSRALEMLRHHQKLQQDFHIQVEKIKELQKQVKEEEDKLAARNKQIHQMRVQLTNDIKKGDEIWAKAKKIKEGNIKESVSNFARGLIELSQSLNDIKQYEKDEHNVQLKEGFQLTHRLFSSTLEKYNIIRYEPQVGAKFDKNSMHVVQELQSEEPKNKQTVAEITKKGWSAEGKVIKLAQVKIYK